MNGFRDIEKTSISLLLASIPLPLLPHITVFPVEPLLFLNSNIKSSIAEERILLIFFVPLIVEELILCFVFVTSIVQEQTNSFFLVPLIVEGQMHYFFFIPSMVEKQILWFVFVPSIV
jgi:hypothetical protein